MRNLARPWSEEELKTLKNEYFTTPIKLLSRKLKRTRREVYARGEKEGWVLGRKGVNRPGRRQRSGAAPVIRKATLRLAEFDSVVRYSVEKRLGYSIRDYPGFSPISGSAV